MKLMSYLVWLVPPSGELIGAHHPVSEVGHVDQLPLYGLIHQWDTLGGRGCSELLAPLGAPGLSERRGSVASNTQLSHSCILRRARSRHHWVPLGYSSLGRSLLTHLVVIFDVDRKARDLARMSHYSAIPPQYVCSCF